MFYKLNIQKMFQIIKKTNNFKKKLLITHFEETFNSQNIVNTNFKQ